MKAEIEKQIHKLAEHMYEIGYEDGRKENTKIADAGYSHGLNDAWECAKKIYGMDRDTRMIALVFNEYETVFDNYSASEAIEKIKEYEKKQIDQMYDDLDAKLIKDDLEDMVEVYGIDKIAEVLEQLKGEE